jgi:hypothetical protein
MQVSYGKLTARGRTPMLRKFHRDVYMPRGLEDACLTALVRRGGRFELSRHAQERVREKGVPLPERIPLQQVMLVEVTSASGMVEQFLIRFPSSDTHDVCLSFNPRTGRVVTG